jgi:aspartate racemase
MLRSLAILERSGVGRIVIPCNTAHYWFDDLQRETDLPLVHIVDAVKRALTLRGPLRNRVGLLATTATVRAGVYARRLAADGIDCLVPTNDEQASVMDVIHRVKSGANDKSCGEFIRSLSDRLLRRGAHAVILGCTELPLVMPTDGNELIDSTEALARECIRLSELDSLQPAFTGVSSSSTR